MANEISAKSKDKPLMVLRGQIKTPPMSEAARIETGHLLRLLQKGETLSMPVSRPMPSIGSGCHELRITDKNSIWRVIYHTGPAIVVLYIFQKKTNQTPQSVIEGCKRLLREFQTARGK